MKRVLARPALVVTVLGLLLAASCGGNEADELDGDTAVQPEVFTAVATDDAMSFVPELEAEPVIIEVANNGTKRVHVAFARLNEGVTPKQVERLFRKNPEAVLKSVVVAGNVESARAGATTQTVFEFAPGSYLLTDPEARGMKPAYFDVVPAMGKLIVEPESDFALETGDFFINIPNGIQSGDVRFVVSNQGEQSHEVVITKGKQEYGFFFAPGPGGRLWQTVRLPVPGTYKAVCYFEDPKTGKPHVKLGMKTQFEVQ